MIFLYLYSSVIVLLIGYFIWNNRNKPPGPWGLPVLGYLPWIDPIYPYKTLTDLSKKYGEIYSIQMGNVYTIVLTNPKTVKSVFMKDVTTGRAPLYLTHGIMKGYGLICSEGELWKDQRKFVHGFLKQLGASKVGQRRNKLESFIKENICEVLAKIQKSDRGEPVCPLTLLSHNLGSLINKIVFGKCWSEDDPLWIWLQKVQDEGAQLMGVAGPLNFLSFFRFIPKYKNIMKFLTEGQLKSHNVYREIIQAEMKRMNENQTLSSDGPNNLIQAFLLERQNRSSEAVLKFYNDQQFLHLLADIFGASLDTTLTTMRWYLLYIAKYSDIQNKVRQEIRDISRGQDLFLEDISHMTFFQATIYETFRIRPVVPVGIPHGVLQDMEINGYQVPKRTMLVPLLWAIHMDDTLWKDPEEFNPYRFIGDEGKIVKSENLLPFQAGKRMCVGDEFAKMILFLYLTSILREYKIELENPEHVDLTGVCGLTMSPKPYKLIFNKIS